MKKVSSQADNRGHFVSHTWAPLNMRFSSLKYLRFHCESEASDLRRSYGSEDIQKEWDCKVLELRGLRDHPILSFRKRINRGPGWERGQWLEVNSGLIKSLDLVLGLLARVWALHAPPWGRGQHAWSRHFPDLELSRHIMPLRGPWR